MQQTLILRVALVGILTVFWPNASFPNQMLTGKPNGDIKGKVTSYGRKGRVTSYSPLRSAWVIVSQNGYEKGRALTGDDGKYYINNLGQGTYSITVCKDKKLYFKGEVNLPEKKLNDIAISGTFRLPSCPN